MIQKEKISEEFEINRPFQSCYFYKYLIEYKLKSAIKYLNIPIKNLKVLDICCGSGMFSHYYSDLGAKVTGIDYSEDCILRAKKRQKKYQLNAEFQVADASKLPYPDSSFDIVSVHDGLHHLPDPHKAIKEMMRIASKAVIIIEPADTFITKISVLLGISQNYEGEDFVYRFKTAEIRDMFKGSKFTLIKTNRYIMFYPHKPGKVFRFLSLPIVNFLVIIPFVIMNNTIGKIFGNKLSFVAIAD